jgi:SAM-dependent methyltransferase
LSERAQSYLLHAPEACRRIGGFAHRRAGNISAAERALAQVRWHVDVEVAEFVVSTPFAAAIALAVLADRPHTLVGERIAAVLPELAALAVPTRAATHEHDVDDAPAPRPLLDHVARALSLAHEVTLPGGSRWLALVTTVLLFADVAKGGDDAQRREWMERLGVDGAVHNEDSAVILGDVFARILRKTACFSGDPRWEKRARALSASTGLVGMHLRGEVGHDAFAPFHAFLATETEHRDDLVTVWSAINHCDTAAVRAGLWTEPLAHAFAAHEAAVAQATSVDVLRELSLAERIARFRKGAVVDASDVAAAEAALVRLGTARAPTVERLARCRTWYAEAALGPLSLDASVRLLALLAAIASHQVDVRSPWHLDLLGIVSRLRDERGRPRHYPVRLLEALLEAADDEELAAGSLGAGHRALVSFPARKGGQDAILVTLAEEDEARALLTLLPIYEHKEAAAFHTTLKALCDLYDLRKDDFDRVANEASYLATMNAARSDKSRMLDFVVPGLVIEVGPGGGVVLDLLEGQLAEGSGRIVGLDASAAVVDALEKRRVHEKHRWEVVHGDAFQLGELFGVGKVSTVVFCSVLHEIFSYVPWADPAGTPPRRFTLASVDAIVAAAFRALAPGGRIVVRDGVMPASAVREVELLDRTWRDGLDLFAKSWEARALSYEAISDMRVRIDARDLLEFITTFTWGPAAFPYEIREQRAVLPRDAYVARLLSVCAAADPPHGAREVPVPSDLASYLQPGYPAGIEAHLRIFDEQGKPVSMPDVTGVWVLEKT